MLSPMLHFDVVTIIFVTSTIRFCRCDCDFDDSTNSYNSTESNEIFVAMTGGDEDYVDMGEAVCSESCQNGCCIDRDTCLCHNGYQPSHIDKFDCEPICGDADIESTGCTNGVCISPQVCECLDGFVLSQMHPFTCITAVDNSDGDDNTHEFRDTTFVFWILTGAGLIFTTVTIIALIMWTSYERKSTYIVDENGNVFWI